MNLESKTNIFIVTDDKPIGFINSLSETQTRNVGYVALFGFNSTYVPSSVTITLDVRNVILSTAFTGKIPDLSDPFDVICIYRESKIDCCDFNIVRYKLCQFISTQSAYQFGANDLCIESAIINCVSVSSHHGSTKEARRILRMVMPNGV